MKPIEQLTKALDQISDPAERLRFLRTVADSDDDQAWRQASCWRWEPVAIDVFVEHEDYLGLRGQVFPKIMDLLVEATTGRYVEIVLTGAIGWGKSFTADLLAAYSLYELSCLANPQRHFGLAEGSVISILQQSVTQQLARKVLFSQISTLIRRSPYFNRIWPYDRSLKTALVFPNGVRMEPIAGNETAAIGQAVYSAILDETNFMAVVQKSRRQPWADVCDAAVENYRALSRRIRTRFMQKGEIPGRIVVVSQSRYPGDFTERKAQQAKTDPLILVADYPHWETNPGKFTGERFQVAIAPQAADQSYVVPEGEEPPEDWDVLDVPEEFRKDFETDIENSLRELGGRSTRAIHPFIVRRKAIADMVKPGRMHPFSKAETTLRDGLEILPQGFDMEVKAPRAVHIDFGLRSDAAGIAIGYAKGMKKVERTAAEVASLRASGDERPDFRVEESPQGLIWVEHLPIIVIEAMLRVVPPPNDEIMFEDIVNLVLRIREMGVPIMYVTADSFQSVAPLQMLRTRGLRTGTVSVDKTMDPYANLKAALYDGRLEAYEYPPVMDELVALERNERDGRVDHLQWMIDEHGKRVAGRKDVADAVAGVLHLLVRRRESWTRADVGEDMIVMDRPDLGPRPSIPRPTFGERQRNEPASGPSTRQPGRVRVRSDSLAPWWANASE